MSAKVETKSKRYIVTISMYMLADSDEEVTKDAHKLCAELNKQNDCKATADLITESNFGTVGSGRVVFK